MKSSIPSEQKISERAYELYLLRGAEDGHDVDDWLSAERELSVEDRSNATPEISVIKETTSVKEPPEAPLRFERAVGRSR